MIRPTVESWAMAIASATAKRATCPRRSVGCVLLDKNNFVIATGYNGVPRNFLHCTELPAKLSILTAKNYTACKGKEHCMAIHAEANALLYCRDITEIRTVVTTCFPCFECAKLLLNTGMTKLVYAERSSLSTSNDYFFNVEIKYEELCG